MSLYFTESEQKAYEASLKEVHFHSRLGFLNAHNGLRKGCLHLILGTTGGGKSTLIRTLLRDAIFNPANDMQTNLLLSEETVRAYKAQIAYGLPSHDRLLSTACLSELEMKGVRNKKNHIEEWLRFYQPELFFYDNVTTAEPYNDKTAREQAAYITWLKELTSELGMATVLVAHTDANATDSMGRLINVNDIRGSKTICNLVEFAYILQRFEIDQEYYPTLRVVKHREQELVHSMYFLQYDKRLRSFSGDTAIEFKKFKEMYGKRNRLDK
jgi:KaiC/GvpD/RAD55 family RecA-like ATPase